MMGLIWGSNVPPLYVDSNGPRCYAIVSNWSTVTISNIQAIHGVRTPTPAAAQKQFSLCFAVETFGRFLTPEEMTYFEILASHYTKPIAPGEPSPPMGDWNSIANYFGEGSKWTSDVLGIIRPTIGSIEKITNGNARVLGTGYPGKSYSLLNSTNFQIWNTVTNKIADTNGAFTLVDGSKTSNTPRFYRVATP
jgi:hypothetical protein